MPNFLQARQPQYHHFVLLVWEECGADGRHESWRLSLQDSQKEVRIGFKNIDGLVAFLERWMESSSETSSAE